jgi:nitroreductase
VKVIDLKTGVPRISAEKEMSCIKCQHCLAICPHAALSILGRDPEESVTLAHNYPAPNNLEVLMKGRRSVRQYQDENLEAGLIERLLGVARHAPTGINMDGVQFTVIDNKEKLHTFREETYASLASLVEANQLPQERAMYASFVKLWQEKGIDVLFRNAPHLVVTSAPKKCSTPEVDSIIALTYFELFAQSMGVGTLWDGLLEWAIDELVPDLKLSLGVPEDHLFGYVMIFGKPAIEYKRTIAKGPANVVTFSG